MSAIEYALIAALIAIAILTGMAMKGVGVKTTVIIHAETPCAYPASFASQINMPACSVSITKK